jgi:hypothetical protein
MKGKNGKRRKPHFTSPVSYLCSAGFTRSQASALLKKGPEGAIGLMHSASDKQPEPKQVPEAERLRSRVEDFERKLERERGRVEGLESAIRLYAHTVRKED